MPGNVFDYLEKPVAVSWPGKRVAVVEISTSTSRDVCPEVRLRSAPATQAVYDLNDVTSVADPIGPIVNPMTPRMRKTVHVWSKGAHAEARSSEGGAGARNVFFINLDYVRSKMSKGDKDYQFTIDTPGNTNGTTVTGVLTAVKWTLTWDTRGPPACTGPLSFGGSFFGFLPGNGFAPLVYRFQDVTTPAGVLDATKSDADAIKAAQEAIVRNGDPCAVNLVFTPTVDFIVPTIFTVDDVLFFDIRVSTYQLTGTSLSTLGAPYDTGTELDFPVFEGSAGWDVEATAFGLGRIKLFGDSGGLATLPPDKLTFTVRFPALEVGARVDAR